MKMTRALFIKVNQLGDSVVNLPALEALVSAYGKENVGVITTPIADGLYERLLSPENRFVMSRDRFNGAWRSPSDFLSILSWIRRFSPHHVLIPYDQGNVARLVARLAGARKIVEMVNPKVRVPSFGAISIPANEARTTHENNWDLFRLFARETGLAETAATPPRPTLAWNQSRPDSSGKKQVLIHPGSSREATRWGTGNFVALARQLAGAGIEVLWIDEAETQPSGEGISILKRRPLQEFADIAVECSLFIGNNSGPMHVCDSLNVPLLILCGPVGPEWDPYWSEDKCLIRTPGLACQPCEGWRKRLTDCLRPDERFACMKRVSVDFVFQKALEVIHRTQKAFP